MRQFARHSVPHLFRFLLRKGWETTNQKRTSAIQAKSSKRICRLTALPGTGPLLQRPHPDRQRVTAQPRHKGRNLRTAVPLCIISHLQQNTGLAKHRPPPLRSRYTLCDLFAGKAAVHLRRKVCTRSPLAEIQPQPCHHRVPRPRIAPMQFCNPLPEVNGDRNKKSDLEIRVENIGPLTWRSAKRVRTLFPTSQPKRPSCLEQCYFRANRAHASGRQVVARNSGSTKCVLSPLSMQVW